MRVTLKSLIVLLGIAILVSGALVVVQGKNAVQPEQSMKPERTEQTEATAQPETLPAAPILPLKTVKSEDDRLVFAFDFDADADGWTAGDNLEPLTVIDGVLQSKATGDAPYLISAPVDFAGQDVTILKIRMWASEHTQAQLFWRNAEGDFGDSQSVPFDINSSGGWQVVNLDLSADPDWTGTEIHELRLQPADDGLDFGIDYIHGIDGSAVVIPACGCKTNF